MRYLTAKFIELLGMIVVLEGLFAGLGLTGKGPSMGKEMMWLCIGGIVFTLGWLLERRR